MEFWIGVEFFKLADIWKEEMTRFSESRMEVTGEREILRNREGPCLLSHIQLLTQLLALLTDSDHKSTLF